MNGGGSFTVVDAVSMAISAAGAYGEAMSKLSTKPAGAGGERSAEQTHVEALWLEPSELFLEWPTLVQTPSAVAVLGATKSELMIAPNTVEAMERAVAEFLLVQEAELAKFDDLDALTANKHAGSAYSNQMKAGLNIGVKALPGATEDAATQFAVAGTAKLTGKVVEGLAAGRGTGQPTASSVIQKVALNKGLASAAQMSEAGIDLFGGRSGRVFRDAAGYARRYGGTAADWVKKGNVATYVAEDGTKFRIHWVEGTSRLASDSTTRQNLARSKPMGIMVSIAMLHEPNQRLDATMIADDVIHGRLHMIDGVRRLLACLGNLGPGIEETPAYRALMAIDSQTDHFPLGQCRRHYAEGYLKELDDEMDACIRDLGDDIREACSEVIRMLR